MKQIPPEFVAYGRTPMFTEHSLPQSLRETHSTKAGVWALIQVESGLARFVIHSEPEEIITLSPGFPGVVEPEIEHHVEPLGQLEMYVELYRRSS